MEEWQSKIEQQINELKEQVRVSCDRRVEKSVMEKHVEDMDKEIRQLENSIDKLLWKGIAGLISAFSAVVVTYLLLSSEITNVKDNDVKHQLEIIKGLTEIQTTIRFMSEDIKELKEEHATKRNYSTL